MLLRVKHWAGYTSPQQTLEPVPCKASLLLWCNYFFKFLSKRFVCKYQHGGSGAALTLNTMCGILNLYLCQDVWEICVVCQDLFAIMSPRLVHVVKSCLVILNPCKMENYFLTSILSVLITLSSTSSRDLSFQPLNSDTSAMINSFYSLNVWYPSFFISRKQNVTSIDWTFFCSL